MSLLPTETPPPPTQTPLPEGILFRDDFEGYFQPGWTWMNEDPERWSLVEFNQGGSLTGYYATTPGEWQRIGAFGNYFRFVSVGIGATNSIPENMNADDIEALFDYFEISTP